MRLPPQCKQRHGQQHLRHSNTHAASLISDLMELQDAAPPQQVAKEPQEDFTQVTPADNAAVASLLGATAMESAAAGLQNLRVHRSELERAREAALAANEPRRSARGSVQEGEEPGQGEGSVK